jgi:hypothetical protein
LPEKDTKNITTTTEPDKDHKLLRIHGWILKQAIDHPHSQNTGLSQNEKLLWTSYCEKLISDKSNLPQELKYIDRERGQWLTFPKSCLILFARKCDILYKEFTNEQNCLQFGKNITEITKMQMQSHLSLQEQFIELLMAQVGEGASKELMEKMHKLWINKFCNVRIKDTFLVAKEKLDLKKSDKITSKTQNLRDGLLTDHVKNKK